MPERVHNSPNLIYSARTQVVTRKPVQGSSGQVVHPAGAVGVIVKSPQDRSHAYRVRFTDGFEAAVRHDNLMLRAEYKQGRINDASQMLAAHGLFDRVIFRCIIGSRAYGLDDENSDIDRRGIYLPPADLHWSLFGVPEQLENEGTQEAYWELQKFIVLALKANPNALECLYTPLVETRTPLADDSPLVVYATPAHEQLKAIAAACITRHHAHHYLGFAATQWRLFKKESPPRMKPLLYVYRVLLTGIHLMQTGRIEANLRRLNESAKLLFVDDLIARKLAGPEKSQLAQADLGFHEAEYHRLAAELESASEMSWLPDQASGRDALNGLLVRLRLATRRVSRQAR